jgi:hypothetical protein
VLKNITFTAEERLIEGARKRAQRERKTLNDAFRDWLSAYAGEAAPADRYRTLSRPLLHVSAGGKFSRDAMNER